MRILVKSASVAVLLVVLVGGLPGGLVGGLPGGLIDGIGEALAEQKLRFWQRVLVTRDREVEDALSHANELYQGTRRAVQDADDEALRERMLGDARGMLVYALHLQPDNQTALETMAMVQEASGRTTAALVYYKAAFRRTDRTPMSTEACVMYGVLLARTGQRARAMDVLRRCVNLNNPLELVANVSRTTGLLALSNLYAAEGRLEDAIELLVRERAERETGILAFALAVLCDKDSQLNRAFELLNYQRQMDERFTLTLARELGTHKFVPTDDHHYFTALLLEARGSLPEAREEWHHYIRSADNARFVARARQHIEAIDALLAP